MRIKISVLLGAIAFLAAQSVFTQAQARSGADCLDCVYTGSRYVDRDSREGVRAVRGARKWHARAKQRYRPVKKEPAVARTTTDPVGSSGETPTPNQETGSIRITGHSTSCLPSKLKGELSRISQRFGAVKVISAKRSGATFTDVNGNEYESLHARCRAVDFEIKNNCLVLEELPYRI